MALKAKVRAEMARCADEVALLCRDLRAEAEWLEDNGRLDECVAHLKTMCARFEEEHAKWRRRGLEWELASQQYVRRDEMERVVKFERRQFGVMLRQALERAK